MGHFSRWHTSKLSSKKWHYTELPWRQLKYRIRCRSRYSFIISWVVWRNASRFRDYKEKHRFGHQLARAQFHTSNFIFFVTDGISSNCSRKYESTMSTEHNHVKLTCYQSALLMPLFIQNFSSVMSTILLISDDVSTNSATSQSHMAKAYVAETSCISCYWFCYASAHNQFARYRQRSNESLRHHWSKGHIHAKQWLPLLGL